MHNSKCMIHNYELKIMNDKGGLCEGITVLIDGEEYSAFVCAFCGSMITQNSVFSILHS